MPSARSSMLDRAASEDRPKTDSASDTRLVEFRGGGFIPKTGRHSGWIALLLVIAL